MDAGKLLLGRFLCDGELSLSEEIELLKHLDKWYTKPEERDALRRAVTCLISSRFLTTRTTLLHRLATETPGEVLVGARKREQGKFTCITEQLLSKYIGGRKAPVCER